MFYIISLIAGIALLASSIFILKDSLDFVKSSERAKGIVTELEKMEDSDGTTYRPIFKFTTNANEEITFRYSVQSSHPSWHVGDEATFAYKSENPDKARLFTYFGVFGWSVILMAVSMPFITIGGGYYIARMYLLKH